MECLGFDFLWPGETAGSGLTPREEAGPGLSLRLFKKIKTHKRTGVPEIGPSGKPVRRRTRVLCGRGRQSARPRGTGHSPSSHEPPPKAAGFRFPVLTNSDTEAEGTVVTGAASSQAGIKLSSDISGPRCPSKYQNRSWK